MRVYLAGPVRGEPAPESTLDGLRQAVETLGHEVLNVLPAPESGGATVQQLDVRTFIAQTDRMLEADLLVADVSTPSHGVGWAIAWFLSKGRLVVLTCRADRRQHLSVMLAGNPSPWQRLVVYESLETLPERLREALG